MNVSAAISPPNSAGGVAAWRKPILFAHIPKTAGTSCLTMFRNLFGDNRLVRVTGDYDALEQRFGELMQSAPGTLSCIAGHVPRHVWEPYADRLRVFTMLRDAVERVLSLYRFLRTASAAGLAELGLVPGFTLQDFITSRAAGTYGQVNDGMCRMLAGDPSLNNPADAAFWNPQAMAGTLPSALALLNTSDFGLVSAMQDSLRLIRQAWDIPFKLVESRENATRQEEDDATVAAIHDIVARNIADIALYHAAQSLFAARVANLTASQTRSGTDKVWHAPFDVATAIADIPGRQGFHDYEHVGFAWLMRGALPRLHFRQPNELSGRRAFVALRVFMISPTYPVERLLVRLNGIAVPVSRSESTGHWCTLSVGPLMFGPGMQEMSIEPPYEVPAPSVTSGSPDQRDLGLALATVRIQA
jgi:hypothetical protein